MSLRGGESAFSELIDRLGLGFLSSIMFPGILFSKAKPTTFFPEKKREGICSPFPPFWVFFL